MKANVFESPAWNKVFAICTALLASYAGYDQYEKRSAPSDTTVTVNVESVPDNMTNVHSHPTVVSRTTIDAVVKQAIADQHAKDLKIFKQKESWE
jgi:hypothetical protein